MLPPSAFLPRSRPRRQQSGGAVRRFCYFMEKGKLHMSFCLALENPPAFSTRQIAAALRQLWIQARALLSGETASEPEHQNAASREAVNRQAEQLLSDYGTSILRMAYSYLHNMSDAEDILQETLIQFLRTAPALESRSHEKAWLLRVAANLSKNRIAYNAVRKTDELDESLAAEHREDLSFVWDAVKELPVKYREVIHLFYYEGYSTAQIASLLLKKEATVRSLLCHGRLRLKEILKEAYNFEQTVS